MNLWSQYANWKNCQIITNNSNMERTTYRMPTHPGDVVKEELEERGISQKEFASRTGISYTMLNEILNSKRPITSEIALVIEAALGINPELLINMQSRYNMVQARMKPAIESNLLTSARFVPRGCYRPKAGMIPRIKTLYPKTRILSWSI